MNELETVTIDVRLEPNDVYTPFMWSRSNAVRWSSAIALSLIFYDLLRFQSQALLSFPGGGGILAVAALLAALILFGLLVFPYLRVRAMFRQSPLLKKPRRYVFSPLGLMTESEDARSECKWPLFNRATETPKLFVFSVTSQQGLYVPKRFFADPEDIGRLRTLIRENMPGKSRLRND